MRKSKIKSNIIIMVMAVGIVLVCTLFMLPLIIVLDKIIMIRRRSDDIVFSYWDDIYPISRIPRFFKE